ncbi:MAG: UDP-2,3-diacylglucosamine diphosphatase [Bacteroidetes bacterium]|nr:UDP-2,3-diacylglucosamine diphosphatase [Bacteroidota bacterium]
MHKVKHFRTIWLSDFHLGSKDAKIDFLLDFLRCNESETLYLVGDIFDGWAMSRAWHWTQSHNDVIQKILRKARKGTRVVYLPGNHDEFARDYLGLRLGRIDVMNQVIHTTADGRKLLVLHGDQFDGFIQHARWISVLGSKIYTILLRLNGMVNRTRRLFGMPYWSLSAYLKHTTKRAVQAIADYENAMIEIAKEKKADGVVCGHIHHAEIREIKSILYANSGDWIESCTAVVEHFDGRIELINWVTFDHQPQLTRWKTNGIQSDMSSDLVTEESI